MKYEETVKRICGEGWEKTDVDERDGGYGVAVLIAFIEGCRANIEDIAKVLVVEPSLIEVAFRRLQSSGVFSMKFNARRDRCLNGHSTAHDGRTAWCHIAAIASGYIGQGYYIQHSPSKDLAVPKS